MNMIKIWHKGQIIALLPAEQQVEIMLSTGKQLHVGIDGIYYITPVLPADQIEITYHDVKD